VKQECHVWMADGVEAGVMAGRRPEPCGIEQAGKLCGMNSSK